MTILELGTWNRLWVGYCPICYRLLAYENDGSSWPPMECQCGAVGGLPEMQDAKLYDPLERKAKLQQKAAGIDPNHEAFMADVGGGC